MLTDQISETKQLKQDIKAKFIKCIPFRIRLVLKILKTCGIEFRYVKYKWWNGEFQENVLRMKETNFAED